MRNFDFLLNENDFETSIQNNVRPVLEKVCTEHYLPVKNGELFTKIYKNKASKNVVVLSHGYTENTEKYLEIIYNFFCLGFSVAMCEHRGHGFSTRHANNIHKIHIDTFDTYIEDFDMFVNYVKTQFSEYNMFLFGHSMGGCIASLYLEAHPENFKAAVLSSPMLKLAVNNVPSPLAWLFGKTLVLLGKAQATPGTVEFTPDEKFEESSCKSRARFDFSRKLKVNEKKYQMVTGTFGWLVGAIEGMSKAQKNANKIQIPLLLLSAGKDNMVRNDGQTAFISKVKNGKLISFPNAKHEIFNGEKSEIEKFWKEIAIFFDCF